jgi:hypothetical protein
MKEHIALLKKRRLPIPKPHLNPRVVIQNERRLKKAV